MARLNKPCVILRSTIGDKRHYAYSETGRIILWRKTLNETLAALDVYGYYIARKHLRNTIIDKVKMQSRL